MTGRAERVGRFGAVRLLALLLLVCGCRTAVDDGGSDVDASVEDASAADATVADAAADDASVEDASAADATVADAAVDDASTPAMDPPVPAAYEVVMTFSTVNVGRSYDTRAQVAAAIGGVGDVLEPKDGPSFIGWQEIGEGDPCGRCEIDVIRARFATDAGWKTKHPRGLRPDGNRELVKVPVTSRGAHDLPLEVRAVFASPGWAGVSPTRFVTVVHYPQRNLSVLDTHFIAGAWSCKSHVDRRRRYWRQAWHILQEEVAREHDAGRNVIVTGDLNRPRGADACNPAWEPESLHPDARVIAGAGIDYVFAVPAASFAFRYARRGDGSIARGTIHLGIDEHRGHWVRGHFEHDG